MKRTDPIRGKTIRFHFEDGVMKGKTFKHQFAQDGGLTFRQVGGDEAGKPTHVEKYEASAVGDDVYAVSYLSDSGYTLTTVLDYRSGKLVGFASNEKSLSSHHGTFDS
jgi:hypothetical protein